ncbi:MAG: hybrid sensor histidine kinase/response regulator [Gammaproteobacteria bacterium]
MKLRTQLFLFLCVFGLAPLLAGVFINIPLIFDSIQLLHHEAHVQNLRAELRDLDQHLASRNETARLLARLPEPGVFLPPDGSDQDTVPLETARSRYSDWLNSFLHDQLDVIAILFLSRNGEVQFWMERDRTTLQLRQGKGEPDMPSAAFIEAGMRLNPGGFLIGPISVDAGAGTQDPRRFMMLRVISPIIGYPAASTVRSADGRPVGSVVINVDVGGLASAFRDTYWVHNDGTYLRYGKPSDAQATAFRDYPGLEEIFAKGNFALWKRGEQQVIWAPLFVTEQSGPLWVGRRLDPAPIVEFRRTLEMRILAIVLALIIIVFVVARWAAVRAEAFGQELADNVGRALKGDEAVRFTRRGPPELRTLAENLSELAEQHAQKSQALRDHTRELEESNRYKSEFLANMSHELRTPLNSILLLSKLLAERPIGSLSADEAKQARVIYQCANDLAGLIDNVLDLSRIEARQTVFRIETLQLPQLLADLIDLVRPQFDTKGLRLALEIDQDAPSSIVSDRDRVCQIVKNFLSNAVKFTRDGEVQVRLGRNTEADATERPVVLSVRDTGIGIHKDKHELIFEAFKQADGSTRRRYGGSGLGLSISRELAQLMGGRIGLISGEGHGSTFSLFLPLRFEPVPTEAQDDACDADEVAGVEPRSMPEADFSSHSVLVVDDEVGNLLELASILEHWGLRVTAAGDGDEALETLAQDADFDLVLMDIMIPGMSGFEVIAHMRAQAHLREVPVLALIEPTDQLDRQSCLAHGADDVITKPVNPVALKNLLADYLPAPVALMGTERA